MEIMPTMEPQSVPAVDEIVAEREITCVIPRSYVDPKFAEMLQGLADQLDAHAEYEEEALDLILVLHEQMDLMLERGDNLSAVRELKKQIRELKYMLSYNELLVSELMIMKYELIETALHQIEVGAEPSTGSKLKFRLGCCLPILFGLPAWASKVGTWIQNLCRLSKEPVKVD